MSWTQRLSDRDARLAGDKFAGRESATERAARKDRAAKQAGIKRAARAGQAWEDDDRRRNG